MPVLLFVVQFWNEGFRSSLVYFGPAIIALVALGIYAWRRHEEVDSAVERRTRALAHALAEKERLLEAVHHRVQNNMQIIASLIRMQDRVKTSPDETIRRIQAMALVHDVVDAQSHLAGVDLAAYIRRFCDTMEEAHGSPRFDLQLDVVTITLDRAMPFALILSEVVTGAMRHATDDAAEAITIALRARAGVAKLVVRDNGTNFDPELDGRGFGPRLIESLSLQLDALTSFEREHGTTFHMTFPLE